MHIVQVLPELHSGGVERGTIEFSRYLVQNGHQSTVISNGGGLVQRLQQEGGQHIVMPVHKKSLFSLRLLKPLKKTLLGLNADVVHVRSRVPAWLVWLAIGRLPRHQRPAIVSTFHGLYSINRYSEIMGCGDRVIAISQCVYDYIQSHYPRIDMDKVSIVHRGVDQTIFNHQRRLNKQASEKAWLEQFFASYPQCKDRPLVVMPGRISPWKGHEDFIALIKKLKQRKIQCHGVIVGDADPKKRAYLASLHQQVEHLGLKEDISFVGHHSNIENVYAIADVVCNLSNRPEPFGRTVIEALAMGVPVVAYDEGGPAESLRACFPDGLAPPNNIDAISEKVQYCLRHKAQAINLPEAFTLPYQAEKTLDVYRQAIQ